MTKILICDSIAQEGKDLLAEADGVEFDDRAGISPEELLETVGEYDGIIIRSATKITAEVIGKADRLKAIARAGVGVDNVDVVAASRKGVIVMNTPGGNTVSTAEHTVALMMALARNLPRACEDLRAGNWNRKKFVGSQLAGKTLGVLGLGRIGTEVAKRGVALEMEVLGLDPFLSEEKARRTGVRLVDDLDEVLRESDYITVHTPLTEKTRDLISEREFGIMKDGVRVINCARGGIINEKALGDAISSGKVAGAALDVYMEEPPENRALVEMENVVATPHLGASTEEAQTNVAVDAARQLIDALTNGVVRFSVNMPTIEAGQMKMLAPYIELAEKIGTFHAQLGTGRLVSVEISCRGDLAELPTGPVTSSVLKGLLAESADASVNAINAAVLARERGISVNEKKMEMTADYTNLIDVVVKTGEGARRIAGTLLGGGDLRIVAIDGYRTDLAPAGDLLVLFGKDRPGLIGEVGRDMGDKGINIAGMSFARSETGGEAICVLNLDGPPPAKAIDELSSLGNIDSVHVVSL